MLVDSDFLRGCCGPPVDGLTLGRALEPAVKLGGLAPLWLRDEVLRLAAEGYPQFRTFWTRPPRLPSTHGACWIILANRDQDHLPLLRPAFLLPLRWVQGQDHSPQLPPRVAELAVRVVESLARPESVGRSGWGLHLSSEDAIDNLDLSELDLDCESGWAPLAAGLILAAEGGRPDPHVWATGKWDVQGGIGAVGHLDAKLGLARAAGVTDFFVPTSLVKHAEDWVRLNRADDLRIGELVSGQRNPRDALREYLAKLDAPPAVSDPFASRKAYYLRHLQAKEYYWNCLLPEIIQMRQEQVRAQWPTWSPSHMVTIVSGSPELVLLGVQAVGAHNCLLLHTADNDGLMRQIRKLLEEKAVQCMPAQFEDGDGMMVQMQDHVRRFAQATGESVDLTFDMTPGNKLMSLSLARLAPRGSSMLYVRHRFNAELKRAEPGTEKIERWIAGEWLEFEKEKST